MLPTNTLNDKGFMLNENKFSWIDLYSDIAYDESINVDLKINDDLQFEGIIKQENRNYAALSLRKKINEETSEEDYLRKLEQGMDGIELNELKIENLDSIYKPLILVVDAVFGEKIIEGGDMLYFNPVLIGRLEENIFKNDERRYPVDYNYPQNKSYTFTITIPDEYVIEEYPESMIIDLLENGGSYAYNISADDNKIVLKTEFILNQTIYPSHNYRELKKFYEMMVAKQAEQVILKRKE